MATTSKPRLSACRSTTENGAGSDVTDGDEGHDGEPAVLAETGSQAGSEAVSGYGESGADGREESPGGQDDYGDETDGDGMASPRPGTLTPGGGEPRDTDSSTAWDTDLEIDDDQERFDLFGAGVYFETCRALNVVPVSYFVRHLRRNELVMKHHGLGPMGAKAIAVPLVSNTMVTELDLEDNWLEAEGADHISDMLKENCYITHLNLANNRIGSEGVRSLCETMVINTTLTYVNLSGNNFQDKDAKLFAAAILENSRIQHLNLSHNSFGEGSGESLGHAIGENETLESLDLSWNNFRCQSANEILNGIQVNSRLKRVNLAWNGLGIEAAATTAACIKNNSILTELDVSSNRINQEAAAIIAKGLEANETLKTLRCGKNPLGANGAFCLLGAIHNERSILEELDLTEVWVEKNFDTLEKEMKQGRPELRIIYGGLIGNYIIRGPKRKPSGAQEDAGGDTTDLEYFLQHDSMARLKAYVERNNLRMIDLFNRFDKNNDYKITRDEFRTGIKSTGIDLTEEEILALTEKLDSIERDGLIDYRPFCGVETDG